MNKDQEIASDRFKGRKSNAASDSTVWHTISYGTVESRSLYELKTI